MATWTEFAAEAPEIAEMGEKRLAATGLMMLGTIRKDGFPRISPAEPVLAEDRLVLHDNRLWLGMMPGSTKSNDLKRDGRFAIHTATADKMVTEGDVKFWGTASEVTDHNVLSGFADAIFESVGYRFEVGTFDAFDLDLLGASSVKVEGDTMYVKIWTPGEGVRVVEKK
jgi:hypothetical protein